MNDECVSGLEVQRIIDSLDRGESRGGDRPGLPQAQSLRNVADALRRYRDVLGVEAPVGIVPAVGIDLIADLEALHLLTHGGDRAGAVGAEHQRKRGVLDALRVAPQMGVPDRDPGGVDGDHHFIRRGFRHRQRVEGDDLRAASTIDRGRLHRLRQANRPVVCRGKPRAHQTRNNEHPGDSQCRHVGRSSLDIPNGRWLAAARIIRPSRGGQPACEP